MVRRVAAIYDIHGNIAALDSVLADIMRNNVDAVIVGGDVAWGPFPRETVERLEQLLPSDVAFVRGNADREVAQRAGVADGLDEVVAAINEWCADQLDDRQRSWLAELPEIASIYIDGIGETVFCHGSPRSDEEILTVATPLRRLKDSLHGVDAPLVVCGHTHMQFDLRVDDKRLINAGSVGLPYEGEPGAYWTLLGPDVELRRSSYDVESALDAMALSGCPHVEMVFIDTLRNPPPQTEVIRQFEGAAEKQTY